MVDKGKERKYIIEKENYLKHFICMFLRSKMEALCSDRKSSIQEHCCG